MALIAAFPCGHSQRAEMPGRRCCYPHLPVSVLAPRCIHPAGRGGLPLESPLPHPGGRWLRFDWPASVTGRKATVSQQTEIALETDESSQLTRFTRYFSLLSAEGVQAPDLAVVLADRAVG